MYAQKLIYKIVTGARERERERLGEEEICWERERGNGSWNNKW